jgi:hypothetical protein
MEHSPDTYRRIENYILGNITPDEIDELWISFMRDQTLYDHFIIELHLRRGYGLIKGSA